MNPTVKRLLGAAILISLTLPLIQAQTSETGVTDAEIRGDAQITFVKDDKGQVTRAVFAPNKVDQEAKKIK